MLDMFGMPGKGLDRRIFTGATSPGVNAATNFWHTWRKPKNARFVAMLIIGAGAGGGKGLTGSAGTARGGGGGAGSAGTVRALFIADMLPDILYIQTPIGGKGEDGTAAVVGGRAWVSVAQSLAVADTVIRSGDSDAPIGATGSASGGAAGSGSSVFTNANAVWSNVAIGLNAVFGATGGNGGNGSSGTAGSASTALNYLPLCGGGGGGSVTTGNTPQAGGAVTGAGSLLPTIPGGAINVEGSAGLFIPQPFIATGGAGGGGSATVGGKGGDGAYGCGGGGGGGGTTGGAGGKGGDSIAFIYCF